MATKKKQHQHQPIPLDFLILECLPDKGMLGGIHWKGRRLKDVYTEILDTQNGVTPSLLKQTDVGSRIRSMHAAGLTESFAAVGSGGLQIWARTDRGKELLARKAEVLG